MWKLSIKTHLNNIWKSVHSIENDIEYRIFEKLCIIEYELSCINKAKLPWINSETETNSSSSDSESTGSDWYDLGPERIVFVLKRKRLTLLSENIVKISIPTVSAFQSSDPSNQI